MKKVFPCSLCHNGILGGALILDDESLTYRTGKLTVDDRYRNYVMPLGEITDISWKRLIFPIASITASDGAKTVFLLFNKKRFLRAYEEAAESWRKRHSADNE